MANRTYTSAFSALRATMELCSEKVSEAYSKPLTELDIYTGELPPGHRATDRRQRFYVTEHERDLIVALPGTTHPLDWTSNMRVHYTPVNGSHAADEPADLEDVPCAHAGFFFRSETVPSVQLLQQAADKGCRLVFTGHSLGGAVANLCALAALNAQRRTLAAAACKAEAEAGAGDSNSNTTPFDAHDQTPAGQAAAAAAAAAATAEGLETEQSGCISNSDFVLSPQAARVEVLAVSFASPIFANAALGRMIEANGWEECFVNLVVPEDYCLNLFNNVLTSAPQPEGKSSSRSPNSRFKATKRQTLYSEPQEPSEDPIPEAPIDAAALPATLDKMQAEHRASSSSRVSCSSTGTPQQPLVSAMAGKSPGKMRSKRQLCFAEPLHQPLDNSPSPAAAATASSTVAGSRWYNRWQEDKSMPRSPSTASLLSEGSSSSTRSWTLLAYLPQSITRSFGSGSGSSTSSRRDSSSGGSTSSSLDGSDCQDLLEEHFTGWGMRHGRSTADVSSKVTLSSNSSSSSSSSSGNGDSRLGGYLDDLAAPFVSQTNSIATTGVEPTIEGVNQVLDSALSEASGGGSGSAWHKQLLQTLKADRKAALRRSFGTASLTAFRQGPKKLLQPLSRALRATDSLSMIASVLPSMRSVVLAGRAVANAAHEVGAKVFNVPLGALEAGLIWALRPPMYEAVGQQWILSATGLVPQHQPIHQYPKHVSDVYWHKELLLVAFKEHSIVFYKQRLLQQASRR